jgi:HEAT repeat protein
MAIPRISRRWRLRTLMAVVAACAVGLAARREYVERGPIDWDLLRLRLGGASARSSAALRLGLLGPRAAIAVGALTASLDDPDRDVRTNAAYSLIRLGRRSPRLLPILAQRIESTPKPKAGFSPRSPVVWSFDRDGLPEGWALWDGGLYDNDPIDALKMIRPDATAFVPLLGKASKSPDRWVRDAALEALFAVATWSDPSSRELAAALVGVLADYPIDPRTRELDAYGQFRDRQRAVEALARLDRAAQERAVALLADDLRDLGSPRSFEAAWLLPRLASGTSTAVAILGDLARDGDETQRLIAPILLEPIGAAAAPAAPALMQAITRPGADRNVRRGFDLSLRWWESLGGREGGPGFRRFLLGTARGEASAVALCVRALRAMGESVERRAIRDLIAVLQGPDGDPDRKRGAIVALGEFGPGAVAASPVLASVIRAGENPRRGPSPDGEVSSLGVPVTEALRKLGSEGSQEAVAGLAGLLEAEDATARYRAAVALEGLGPRARTAAPALVKALRNRDPAVRRWSAMALRAIGDREVRAALPALLANLDDEDLLARVHAARAVALLGAEAKDAVPKIVRLIWDFGPHFGVARSLGEIGPDAAVAVPPLIAHWDGASAPTHQEIEAALEHIMPRSPGATIAAMKAGDPVGRSRATYELGRLIEEPPRPAKAVAALGEALGDPDPLVRQIAAAVLGRLAPTAPEAGPPLSRAARDPDGSVRRLATWGLGRARR